MYLKTRQVMQRFLFLFSLVFLLSNCKKEEPVLFTMPYQETFEIPAGLNTIDTHHFVLSNISSNKANFFSANNVTDDDVVTINPELCRMTSVLNANYDFLFNVSIRMYTDNPDTYKEIFYRDNVPSNTGSQLDLIPTLVNVRDFLVAETFTVEVVLERPRVPSPEFIDTVIRMDFAVR